MKNLLNLFLFIIICPACNQAEKQETQPNPTRLKIISHNVWYGFTKVPERKELWLEWMNTQNPDVVSLQELNEYTPQMLAADAEQYSHPYSELLKQEGFPTGITSKYPIEDTRRTLEGFHHGLLRVRIQGIYYYVIHLHPSNWEVRKREIDKILQDIDTLPPGSPVILAGDFNTLSPLDSNHYLQPRLEAFFGDRDLRINENNLKQGKLDYSVIQEAMNHGLVDLELKTKGTSYQFSGSMPTLIEKEGEHGDSRRIDYIFSSKDLAAKAISAKVVANDTTQYLSDHLPVIAELTIP